MQFDPWNIENWDIKSYLSQNHKTIIYAPSINISAASEEEKQIIKNELTNEGIEFCERKATTSSQHINKGDMTLRIIGPESIFKWYGMVLDMHARSPGKRDYHEGLYGTSLLYKKYRVITEPVQEYEEKQRIAAKRQKTIDTARKMEELYNENPEECKKFLVVFLSEALKDSHTRGEIFSLLSRYNPENVEKTPTQTITRANKGRD